MKHLDLFSGIGGFSLAARWMGWETVAWVEINEYCQKVLRKNFPEAKGYGDIKEFDRTIYRGSVDIITGGFPCQPFSTAGKRLGTDDPRHLWPEMLRIVDEFQPSFVVGENVHGITNWSNGLVFEMVCHDMEAKGYEVAPVILPAASVGAPHRRDRCWFVAYSHCNDARRREHGETGCKATVIESEEEERQRLRSFVKRVGGEGPIANSEQIRLQDRNAKPSRGRTQSVTERLCGITEWDDFPTVSGVCRGNDGVPNRVDRIAALGNAIVPQVALQIFKAIEATILK